MQSFLVGGSSIGAVQLIDSVPVDGLPLGEIVKVVVQLVIGVATLVHFFKKPKPPKTA